MTDDIKTEFREWVIGSAFCKEEYKNVQMHCSPTLDAFSSMTVRFW